MTRTLQIRDVPEDLHATVRTRAAQAGVSVSAYLLNLVSELVTQPTMGEVVERAKRLARAGGGTTHSDVQAAIRQSRER